MAKTRFRGPIKITETGTSTNAGSQTIAGTLAVTGASTLTGNVTHSGTLTQTGAMTAASTLAVTGAITATGGVVGNVTGSASSNLSATANQYGLLVSGAANVATVLAPDASTTKVLTSAGTGANPTWTAPANPTGFFTPVVAIITMTGNITSNGDGAVHQFTNLTAGVDTASAFASNTYTIPSTGNYFISSVAYWQVGGAAASKYYNPIIYKNGAAINEATGACAVSFDHSPSTPYAGAFTAGNTVTFYYRCNANYDILYNANSSPSTQWIIQRIS